MSRLGDFSRIQGDCSILISLVRSQVSGRLWQLVLQLRRSVDECRRLRPFRPEVESAFLLAASRITREGFSVIEQGRVPRAALSDLVHLYSDLILSWSRDRRGGTRWLVVARQTRLLR